MILMNILLLLFFSLLIINYYTISDILCFYLTFIYRLEQKTKTTTGERLLCVGKGKNLTPLISF